MNSYRATLAALEAMMEATSMEAEAFRALDADLDRIRRIAAMPKKNCSFRMRPDVMLTVYFVDEFRDKNIRERTGEYTRGQAALRLKWARHLPNFKGHKTEAVKS